MAVVEDPAARPARRPGGLLWQRNFRLLWFGETISAVGSSMAAVGVPVLAVAVLHASTFAVSALTAAAYLPWLVIGLPAGAWVDRLPPRRLMIACDLASAAAYASLPVAAWAGVLTIGQVLIVALVSGVASVFFGTAYQVYLPVLVESHDLMEGNAKLQGSQSVAAISGRGVAGLAAEAVGAAAALLFNAFSFLVSAVCLLSIQAEAPAHEHARRTTSMRADIAEGLRFLWRDPLLRSLAIFPAVANLAYGGVLAIAVVFLIRVAHFDAAAVGLLTAAGSAGGVLGALVARREAKRVGTARAGIGAVRVADPADRSRAARRVLRCGLGHSDCQHHRRQCHHRQLPADLHPAGNARPDHRQPAVPHLWHSSARRTAGRRARYRAERQGRALDPASDLRAVRHAAPHAPDAG
jgi:MFS family permease